MPPEFINEFISQCLYRIDENTKKLTSCFNELEEMETWKRPNENLNSVGNLVLHLCGNIRQYAISSLGQLEDIRERDKEFSATGGYSKSELLEKLLGTVEEAKNIIQSTGAEELFKTKARAGVLLFGHRHHHSYNGTLFLPYRPNYFLDQIIEE